IRSFAEEKRVSGKVRLFGVDVHNYSHFKGLCEYGISAHGGVIAECLPVKWSNKFSLVVSHYAAAYYSKHPLLLFEEVFRVLGVSGEAYLNIGIDKLPVICNGMPELVAIENIFQDIRRQGINIQISRSTCSVDQLLWVVFIKRENSEQELNFPFASDFTRDRELRTGKFILSRLMSASSPVINKLQELHKALDEAIFEGDYKRARVLAIKHVLANPQDNEAKLLLSWFLLQKGAFGQAGRTVFNVERNQPDEIQRQKALMLRIEIAEQAGKPTAELLNRLLLDTSFLEDAMRQRKEEMLEAKRERARKLAIPVVHYKAVIKTSQSEWERFDAVHELRLIGNNEAVESLVEFFNSPDNGVAIGSINAVFDIVSENRKGWKRAARELVNCPPINNKDAELTLITCLKVLVFNKKNSFTLNLLEKAVKGLNQFNPVHRRAKEVLKGTLSSSPVEKTQDLVKPQIPRFIPFAIRYPVEIVTRNKIGRAQLLSDFFLKQRLQDNLFYANASYEQRSRIIQRIRSLGGIVDFVNRYMQSLHPDLKIVNISSHGSYIYGGEEIFPDDIDLQVLVKDNHLRERSETVCFDQNMPCFNGLKRQAHKISLSLRGEDNFRYGVVDSLSKLDVNKQRFYIDRSVPFLYEQRVTLDGYDFADNAELRQANIMAGLSALLWNAYKRIYYLNFNQPSPEMILHQLSKAISRIYHAFLVLLPYVPDFNPEQKIMFNLRNRFEKREVSAFAINQIWIRINNEFEKRYAQSQKTRIDPDVFSSSPVKLEIKDRVLKDIIRILEKTEFKDKYRFLFFGGLVRDLAAGRPIANKDIDFIIPMEINDSDKRFISRSKAPAPHMRFRQQEE
ncbi:MAG: hypothetical protein WC357_10005, partial [Candidatus Omnitrophota bacterium]